MLNKLCATCLPDNILIKKTKILTIDQILICGLNRTLRWRQLLLLLLLWCVFCPCNTIYQIQLMERPKTRQSKTVGPVAKMRCSAQYIQIPLRLFVFWKLSFEIQRPEILNSQIRKSGIKLICFCYINIRTTRCISTQWSLCSYPTPLIGSCDHPAVFLFTHCWFSVSYTWGSYIFTWTRFWLYLSYSFPEDCVLFSESRNLCTSVKESWRILMGMLIFCSFSVSPSAASSRPIFWVFWIFCF